MRQLIYNAVRCRDCEKTIVSYSRHDYQTCGCDNMAMVDGGLDYGRYGAMDMDKIEKIDIYADDDFEIVRKYAYRGSRGKDGKHPLRYIPICELDDDYLEAILEYGGADWHLELIKKEIEYRNMNITHDNEGFKESSKDSIVQDVINQFKLRSSIGIRKYGVTLDREDLTTLEWLNHLQEELQDATLYVQRIKKELDSKIANEDFDHWCAYSGIHGENRKELERIINILIHGK